MTTRIRLIVAVLLALSLASIRPAHLTLAATGTQVADCTFATLQSDLQAGGDYYYTAGQCPSPITFTGTITIGQNASLTAQGHDITLDGGGSVRLFWVNGGVSFGLTGLTLTRGSGSRNSGEYGGAIFNAGGLTITNSTFTNNAVSGALANGGAIRNDGGVTITNSTFSGNSADLGGVVFTTTSMTVTNSTFSGNTAGDSGGAIYAGGGPVTVADNTFFGNHASYGGAIDAEDVTTVTDSTFAGNGATAGGGAIIVGTNAKLTVGGSIFASATTDNCDRVDGVAITDAGYNLESGSNCGFNGTGDLQNTDPKLDPTGLQSNGGPTQTIALQPTSPAIDAVPTSSGLCSATDQRGGIRPDGETTCDMGSYEYLDTTPCPTTGSALANDIRAAGPGGTVSLNCATPTTVHFQSPITISQSVTLDGSGSPGAVTLDGGGSTTLFTVNAGVTFGLSHLTLQNAGGSSTANGGAISNQGTVRITDSTLSGNSTIYAGGAIWNTGTVTITDSTLANDTADASGGAIASTGTLTITDSTLAGNSATSGGAIWNGGTVSVGGSIIANSTSGGNCSNGNYSITGTVADLGYNLTDSSGNCGLTGSTDLTNTDPHLAALQNNGGPTQTMALQSTSSAVDQIPAASCPATDQRGVTRPDNAETSCDMGAYEWPDPILPTTLSLVSGSGPYKGSATLTATLTSNGTPLSGKTISFGLNGTTFCGFEAGVACPVTDSNGVATFHTLALTWLNAGTFPGAVAANFAGSMNGDTNYGASGATGDLTIAQATQTITFGTLSNRTYGDADFPVSATASSGLPVSFTAAGPCTVAQNSSTGAWTVHLTGAGTGSSGCTLTASQAGNTNYTPAQSVSQSFDIAQGTPAFTFDLSRLPAQTYGNQPFSVAGYATTTSTGAISFALGTGSVGCTVTSAGQVTITGAAVSNNACIIQASLAADPNNLAAGPLTQSFHIAQAGQTISFGTLANHTYGDAPVAVSATASSGLPVNFTVGSTDQCTIAGSTVTITGAGSCTVTASQSGNANYNPATSVSQSFTIAKAAATIALDASSLSATYDGNLHLATATTTPSGLSYSVAYVDASNTPVISPASAGSYAVTASVTDSNYQGSTTGTLVISKANQSIAVTSHAPSSATYGSTFTVVAAASSGLSVTYGSSGSCSNSGATVTMTSGTGTCKVTYDQAGKGNYTAAPEVSETVTAQKANQTITFGSISNHTYGDASSTVSASTSSGLAVSFSASGTCTVAGNTVTITGAGSCTVTAVQSGNGNYSPAASVSQTFAIARAGTTTTVTSSVSPSLVKQGVTVTVKVTSGAGAPGGTVTITDKTTAGTIALASGIPLDGTGSASFTTSALAAGTHNISASYSGNANFAGGTTSSPLSQQVRYAVKVLSTSGLTRVLQLQDFTGANVSSSNLTVTAQCVVPYGATPPTTCPTTPVQSISKAFAFTNNYKGLGPAYSYSINPHGLTTGQQYDLLVQAGGDPIWHAIPFTA